MVKMGTIILYKYKIMYMEIYNTYFVYILL